MLFNETRLQEQANKALDVTERVLNGEDVPKEQRQMALALIGMPIKSRQVQNGRDRNAISLIKLGLRDQAVREKMALRVLSDIYPTTSLVDPLQTQTVCDGTR
jgi:hypothetical protein